MRDTIEVNGRTFKVEIEADDHNDAPWENDCGTGYVTEWRRGRDKEPGERILCQDRGSYRFYDMERTMRKAKRDGWGLTDADKAKLAIRLNHEPRKGEIIAEAVERDFNRLRAWCNDEWQYVGVIVTDEETGRAASLWGIESDSDDYLAEVARELADEMFPLSEANEAAAIELATD